METAWMTIGAFVVLTLAGYAQYRIPAHTAGVGKVRAVRVVLAAVGAGLGWIAAGYYPDDYPRAVLAFLIGLGLAHVPAAIILFVKTRRGEGRS